MRAGTIKSIAAVALTGVGTALVVGFSPSGASVPVATAPTTDANTVSTLTGQSGSTAAPASSAATAATAAGTYKDGTYTGTAVQEPWGSFRVQAVISGGKITNVVLVQSPQDGRSSQINSRAVPTLTQSAIATQSAKIDMVSGATWTSQSYITSLQSALDQAKA